jgi:hypothetical protein
MLVQIDVWGEVVGMTRDFCLVSEQRAAGFGSAEVLGGWGLGPGFKSFDDPAAPAPPLLFNPTTSSSSSLYFYSILFYYYYYFL